MNRAARFALIALIAIAATAGTVLYQGYRFARTAPSSDATTVVFEVRNGQTLSDVAKRLETEGLITDSRKFRLYARVKSLGGSVRVGEYALRRNMSPGEILRILASGRSIEYVVTVTEGLNRFEIASIVEKVGIGTREEFLKLTQDPDQIKVLLGDLAPKLEGPTLEGFLFPETYYVTRASGVRGLLKQMVGKFREKFLSVDMGALGSGAAEPLSPREVVILASIVEKETGAPEERPVISSVFHNRLRKKMKLQTDPTVIYGIWSKTGSWNRNISRQDLVTPTEYNTYVIEGLPPAPISNPGLLALQAAARPAKSEFLFFVSRNDGTHVFSREYGQHQKAVGEFQMKSKAREGHSWRELKNRKDKPNAVVEAPRSNPKGKKVGR